jgi:hypothetical protein
LPTDQEAVDAAFTTIGAIKAEEARVVHIKNTLEIAELHISESLLEDMEKRDGLTLLKELGPLAFDQAGALQRVSFL